MFFFILGPFVTVIFFCKPGIKLLRNMEFYGNTLVTYVQSIIFATNIFCSVSYFTSENESIEFIELAYLWALMFNVCLIISAKYATFSHEFIQVYKSVVLPIPTKKRMQYLHFHTPISVEARYTELWAAYKRYEFEPSLFYLSFFIDPKENLIKEIDGYIEELKKVHKNPEPFQPEPLLLNGNEKIYGFGAAYKLLDTYDTMSNWKCHAIAAYIVSVSLALIQVVYRGASGKDIPNQGYALFQLIFMIITEVYCGLICFIFLIISLRDIKKKKFMLTQCGYMISTRRNFSRGKRIMPTIDITDPQSIMAWTMLRKMCLDYGKQYTIRTQAFYSFIILYSIAASVILLLYFFDVVLFSAFTLIYMGLGMCIFLYLLVSLFIEQAYLNEFFEVFRNQIEDWISIVLDVQRMKKFYFEEGIGKQKQKIKVPYNYWHRMIVEFIMEKTRSIEEVNDQLEAIQQSLEDAIRHLHQDERNNSFSFYGFTVTFDKLWGVAAGIGTVAGFALDQFSKQD